MDGFDTSNITVGEAEGENVEKEEEEEEEEDEEDEWEEEGEEMELEMLADGSMALKAPISAVVKPTVNKQGHGKGDKKKKTRRRRRLPGFLDGLINKHAQLVLEKMLVAGKDIHRHTSKYNPEVSYLIGY